MRCFSGPYEHLSFFNLRISEYLVGIATCSISCREMLQDPVEISNRFSVCNDTTVSEVHEVFVVLSTQTIIICTPKWVGELIPGILHIILVICPSSELITEVCKFQCLEHGPTELRIWLSGE